MTRPTSGRAAIKVGAAPAISSKYLQASLKGVSPSLKGVSPRFSARNPKFLARDNKICVSALWYMGTPPRAKLVLPEPACHETTFWSGFQLFGFLVYAVQRCGRFFGFDDDLWHRCPLRLKQTMAWIASSGPGCGRETLTRAVRSGTRHTARQTTRGQAHYAPGAP